MPAPSTTSSSRSAKPVSAPLSSAPAPSSASPPRSPPVSIRLLQPNPGAKTPGKIVGRSGEEYFLLDLDDVLAFQAGRELVWIVTARQRFLATQTLRAIEARLADSRFKRVHRNALVKVGHVRKMRALSGQRWLITLSNSLQVTVSERQAHQIRQVLQW